MLFEMCACVCVNGRHRQQVETKFSHSKTSQSSPLQTTWWDRIAWTRLTLLNSEDDAQSVHSRHETSEIRVKKLGCAYRSVSPSCIHCVASAGHDTQTKWGFGSILQTHSPWRVEHDPKHKALSTMLCRCNGILRLWHATARHEPLRLPIAWTPQPAGCRDDLLCAPRARIVAHFLAQARHHSLWLEAAKRPAQSWFQQSSRLRHQARRLWPRTRCHTGVCWVACVSLALSCILRTRVPWPRWLVDSVITRNLLNDVEFNHQVLCWIVFMTFLSAETMFMRGRSGNLGVILDKIISRLWGVGINIVGIFNLCPLQPLHCLGDFST